MGPAAAGSRGRALTGAVLLDLAVSPLFAWDVFTESLQRDLGRGGAVLTSVFSVGLVAFMAGVLIGGRLADSFSPRRLAVVTGVGTVLGLLGSAVATSVAMMVVAFGVLLGASTGLGYATAVRVAATMRSGRGLALGLVVSAYALGTAVLAPVAAAVLAAVGRSSTFVLLAAALGVVLVAAAVLVPGEAPESRPPDDRADDRAGGGPDSGGRRIRPSGPVVALWLAFGLGSAPALAAFAQAGQLAGTVGAVALAVTLLNVGNFVGRLTAGPLSDRLGRRATLHLNSALLVVACVPLAAGGTGPAALVALFMLGTQYGALSTLTPAATADVVPSERFGRTYGLVFTGWGIAGLIAPTATAAIAITAGYDGSYRILLVIAALSWVCVAAYARLANQQTQPAAMPPGTS